MEKIKNILKPGHKHNDEAHASGDPSQTSGNPIKTNKTGDDTGPTSTFSGYGNTPVPGANRAEVDKPYYEGNQPLTTEPVGTTDPTGTFSDDIATTASVKSGVIGESQGGSGLTGSGVTGSDTNKPLPLEPESAGTGHLGGSATGTNSGLTGSSLPDRSVGSSGYGETSTGDSSHLGRDAALGAGAGALGASAVSGHQREGQEIGGDTGRSFPLGGSSASDTTRDESGLGTTSSGIGSGTGPTIGSSHQGSLERDIPLTGAYNEESWKHDHSARGHEYGGDPCEGPEASAPGAVHFTKGPHALETANRLDPHVNAGPTESVNTGASATTDTGLDSSSTGTGLDTTASDTGLGSSGAGDHQYGRDAALAGGAGAAGYGAYQSSRDGTSSTTAGPHSSDALNKADPRVDSDLSGQRSTSNIPLGSDVSGQRGATSVGPASGVVGSSADGTSLPSDIPTGQTTNQSPHLGRDAGLGAGAGAAGLGAYEAGKHQGISQPGLSSRINDPYNSSAIDPRVDSTSRSGTSGLGETSDPSSTSRSGLNEPTSTGKDHHYGRDAGLVGAGGLAAYEGEKHLGGSKQDSSYATQPSTGASPATGAPYDSKVGPATGTSQTGIGGGAVAYEAEKHMPGKNDRSSETYPTDPAEKHHYGRDAAIGAGGVGLAGAAYEADKRHAEPSSTTGPGGYDTHELEHDTRDPTQSHTGRDAALAGGAGAGAGAIAGEELSKKDLKHQQHELEKEQKAHQKELEKEQKAHQKEVDKEVKAEHKAHDAAVAKEQKAHQKEVEKVEKRHEKEVAKAEKQHEKELEKEEKQGEKKKHGGILGLFHRDKPDDELKKEELQRRGEYVEPDISRDGAAGSIQNPELTHSRQDTGPTGPETMGSGPTGPETIGASGAGAGTTGISDFEQHKRAGDFEGMSESDKLMQAKEHDRNRLHKDPPPGYIEKKLHEQGVGSSGGQETLPDGRVVEPHTGLPMDLSKGDGAGGTDSTPTSGYHSHGTH